ncbi:hypothetical protein [Methylobacterium komagatae]
MSKRRYHWTPEQLDRMADMVEAGIPRPRIAAAMDANVAAVEWQLLRLGVVGPRSGKVGKGGKDYVRGERIVRRFTPEEDAQLLLLEAEGLGTSEIGRRLGRAHHTVIGRLATLARHEQLDEEKRSGGRG